MKRLFLMVSAASLLGIAACTRESIAPTGISSPQALRIGVGDSECPGCVVGPITFTRTWGAPKTETIHFPGDPLADYVIDITDNGSHGANAHVRLNGAEIVSPGGGRDTFRLRQSVSLGDQNTLQVRLTGVPGSTLTVSIIGGVETVDGGGGTVTAPGGLAIHVPPGAVNEPVDFAIQPATVALPGVLPGQVLAAVSLEPAGLVFSEPVEVAWPISAFGLTPEQLENVRILHLTADQLGSWTEPATVTSDGDSVTFSLSSFSFGIITGSTAWTPPSTYALEGWRWTTTALRWSLLPSVGTRSRLSQADWQRAFDQWAAQSQLTFVYEPDRSKAQIIVQDTWDLSSQPSTCSGLGFSIDSRRDGQTVGLTCYPFPLSLMSDLSPNRQVLVFIATNAIDGSGYDPDQVAFKVARHEIGHAVGIDHPARQRPSDPVIMHQMRDGSVGRPDLADWDIAAVQALYGQETTCVQPLCDDFEYTDSPANHGWTVASTGGAAPVSEVRTITEVKFSGERSVYLLNGSMTRPLTDVALGDVESFSIMYYDSLQTVVFNSDVFAYVNFSGGTCANASLGYYNPATYYVLFCGTEFASTVPRSKGWHKFEWRFSSTEFSLYVDNVFVISRTLAGESLREFSFNTGQEPGLIAHFDRYEVKLRP